MKPDRLKHLLLLAATLLEEGKIPIISSMPHEIKTFEDCNQVREAMAFAIRYWLADTLAKPYISHTPTDPSCIDPTD
jgi:hypothetical protein